jgi:hypothetical protein
MFPKMIAFLKEIVKQTSRRRIFKAVSVNSDPDRHPDESQDPDAQPGVRTGT